MSDTIYKFFTRISQLIHRIILSIYYTGSPHITDEKIQRFMKLVQSHRTVGRGTGFESMSPWLQGSCVVYMAIYSNFVLFVIAKCNKEDKFANGPPEMGTFKVSTVEMGSVNYL